MSVSKTILIGNVGNDPELKSFSDGTAVCNLSLATNEKWRDKNSGEQRERVEWHRIVIVGKLAEIAAQYLAKGSKVYIEGQNRTREWEKDGVKRYTTEIHVGMRGTMQMLDSREDSGVQNANRAPQNNQQRQQGGQQYYGQQKNNSGQQYQGQQQSAQQSHPAGDAFDDDSDIPF